MTPLNPARSGLFHVTCDETPYLTLVVRAFSEDHAREIGRRAVGTYLDHLPAVDVEWIDPWGPPGVVVEDPS